MNSNVVFAPSSESTTIKQGTFISSKKLQKFDFPEKLKIIKKQTFAFTNLKKVNLLYHEKTFIYDK